MPIENGRKRCILLELEKRKLNNASYVDMKNLCLADWLKRVGVFFVVITHIEEQSPKMQEKLFNCGMDWSEEK